jgi:hypothetical protein
MNKFEKVWYRMTYKSNLSKDFTSSYYKDLIELWRERYGFIMFTDSYMKKGVLLRHDIDTDIDKAVLMAEIEAGIDNDLNRVMFEHGDKQRVHSTYFALNTAKYWGSQYMTEALLYIQALGHEVGWHNNSITDYLTTCKPMEVCIREPVDYLRSLGLVIRGSAAHGDRLCYKHRYINYNVFGYKSRGWDYWDHYLGGKMVRSMGDFGLEYEAYHVLYNGYLADSYTGWAGDPARPFLSRTQVLIHPHCWRLK